MTDGRTSETNETDGRTSETNETDGRTSETDGQTEQGVDC